MPFTTAAIEYLPAGCADEAVNYEEAEVELEYDFDPSEPAVMDVNSPMSGPGCAADAEIIEDTIRRTDGEPVCDALLAATKAWWARHGREGAIEREEDDLAERRAARRSRRALVDPCDL